MHLSYAAIFLHAHFNSEDDLPTLSRKYLFQLQRSVYMAFLGVKGRNHVTLEISSCSYLFKI